MKLSKTWSRCGVAALVTGVIVGCSALFTQGGGGGGGNGAAGSPGGFATVDSYFTEAPVSPGGTAVPAPDDVVVDGTTTGDETRSFFKAYQIDPSSEDSAGPKFVISADVDQDGFPDLISAWNQSQPIQLHLQRRDEAGNISFRTVTLAGTTPVAVVAGIAVGQIDDDGFLDLVILVKATGFVTLCPPENPGDPPTVISATEGEIIVLFSPGNANLIPDGDRWTEMILVNPFVQDPWIHNQFPGIEEKEFEEGKTHPENNGFTSLAVGNIDGVPGDDIVVALNPGECKTLSQQPPTNTVDLWVNPGDTVARTSALWGAPPPGAQSRGVPVSLIADAPQIRDINLLDVDDDGDLDVVAAVSNSISQNVRWARNPLVPHAPGGPGGFNEVVRGFDDGWRFFGAGWEVRPVGQLDTGADSLDVGDVDGDGFPDVLVRSTNGRLVQWFRRPNALVVQPEFPPADPTPDRFNFPWPVFTLTEFANQTPEAIALGDINNDGVLELMVAAEGAVYWYDSTPAPTIFDAWSPNTIIQDSPEVVVDQTAAAPVPGAGVGVTEVDTDTVINALLVVDLDEDGRNDIIGTLDRRSDSGLSDDRLVWYRNIRTEDD